MKKTILLAFVFVVTFTCYSQTNSGTITGYFNLSIGQKATYTASSNAQCENCYDWDINGNNISDQNTSHGNVKIVGSDQNKTIEIVALEAGHFELKVNYMDEEGFHSDVFSGNVILSDNSCAYNIAINDSYEYSDNSNLESIKISAESNYPAGTTYSWIVFKQDGSFEEFPSVLTASISTTATPENRITRAVLTAEYQNCSNSIEQSFEKAIPYLDSLGNLFPECKPIDQENEALANNKSKDSKKVIKEIKIKALAGNNKSKRFK